MELHLAPLENLSCWAFRSLCSGATDSYTGMLSLNNLIRRNNSWEEVDTYPIEGQRQWIQIATNKEKEIALFLSKLETELKKHPTKQNVYGIQLNCSCPSPGLISIGQGPALIKRSTKVISLLTALLKHGSYQVGIKVRLGLNKREVEQRKIITLFRELEKLALTNPRFSNVTVHFKHAGESSSTSYDYSLLNELASYSVPLIINGGLTNIQEIKRLIMSIDPKNRKNVRGIMIGRAAMHNPDCFREIASNEPIIYRTQSELKSTFNRLCIEHLPKNIYLKTITQRTTLG